MVEFGKEILFFLSSLGAFNGLLLSIYLFTLRTRHKSYLFLSLLLVMISIRVGKSVFFYFEPNLSKHFLQLGLSACFLIGPLLYFYCASATKKLDSMAIKWQWHLGALAVFVIGFGATYPYASNLELWGHYAYKSVNWIWLFYILLATVHIRPIAMQRKFQFKAFTSDELLMLTVFAGVSLIWLAYVSVSYTSYIVGALSFSFSLYLSALLYLRHLKVMKTEKYVDKKIEEPLANNLFQQLQTLMQNEKLYCDPRLTLGKLAKKMGVSSTQLSQLLNDNFHMSFPTLLNEYRIAEAKILLLSDANLNMENIAERVGYNSMSTFYSAFKKIAQVPPARFRQMQS